MNKKLKNKIDNAFVYHAPVASQPQKYQTIRTQARDLAYTIAELCPESDEMLVALQYLQTTVMWANAAIAMHGKK